MYVNGDIQTWRRNSVRTVFAAAQPAKPMGHPDNGRKPLVRELYENLTRGIVMLQLLLL